MAEIIKQPIITTLTATLKADAKPRFVNWQTQFASSIVGCEGFVSLEFLTKPDAADAWMIVQRFYNTRSAETWKHSLKYKGLIDQLLPLLSPKGLSEKIENEAEMKSGITEVIITDVQPNFERAFREWSAKIHEIEAKFEGFRGVYIQSPQEKGGKHWITLLQFDTATHLDQWLTSKERQEILKQGEPLITSLETNRIASPFAGWFSSIAKSSDLPSVWQQTMIVLLILFPIVMLELKYLVPLTAGLNSSLGTFIGNSISVTLIAYPFMPLVLPLLNWWLFPNRKYSAFMTFFGTLFVLFLYFVEIALFWNFL